MSHPPLLSAPLLYGLLAGTLNRALVGDEYGQPRLAALDGTVIRLRGERPDWLLYALIHEDGVELLQDYDGPVDVRISGPLGAMLHWLIQEDGPADDALRINGDASTLAQLRELAGEFSLWALVRRWVEDHVQLKALLELLRREDPHWLAALSGLPDQVGTLATQLAQQQLLQEDVLDELRRLRRDVQRARRLDLAFLVVTVAVIAVAVLHAVGRWQHAWALLSGNPLSLALASLAVALVASRLVSRH